MSLKMCGICYTILWTIWWTTLRIQQIGEARGHKLQRPEAEVSKCCDISWANWRPVRSDAGGAGRWYITMPIRLNYPGPWCCSTSLLITSNLPRCWHQHHNNNNHIHGIFHHWKHVPSGIHGAWNNGSKLLELSIAHAMTMFCVLFRYLIC